MFSKPLLKKTVKDNYKFWLWITVGLSLMLVMFMVMAQNFMDREGPGGAFASVDGGSIISQFYSMFAMLLPMIYIVITANKLIAAQVDKCSMAYIMSKPLKRNQVSLTQALYLIGSIVAMFGVITAVGLAMIGITGLEIEIGAFLLLNLGVVLFHLAISGISYMASCIFNTSSGSLLIGAGIPVLFFVFDMLSGFSNLAEIMENFKYISLNTLYNTADVLSYSLNMIWQFLILFAVGAACYVTGVMYFKKKDLPI